jgi:hypothetical protein
LLAQLGKTPFKKREPTQGGVALKGSFSSPCLFVRPVGLVSSLYINSLFFLNLIEGHSSCCYVKKKIAGSIKRKKNKAPYLGDWDRAFNLTHKK